MTEEVDTAATEARVREWNEDEGWGVLDSEETPGGCWTHFSHIEAVGYLNLNAGQRVRLVWEAARQDGYNSRAMRVLP